MCKDSPIPCNCGCNPAKSLGKTATAKRTLKSGQQYDAFFPAPAGNAVNLGRGNQKKTLRLMEAWIKKHRGQTKKIAQHLQGRNLINTLSNLWHFLYEHVQYKLDADGLEQLRTPARLWADRTEGVDCDCYSIFISSVLHNLGISHALRMVKYRGDWQHVYVVVPKNGDISGLQRRPDYFVIDPVVDQFDFEEPFTKKHDRFMTIPIQGLSGIDESAAACPAVEMGVTYEDVAAIERQGNVVTSKILDEFGIAYQQIQKAGHGLLEIINSEGQALELPTVISGEKAEQLKNQLTAFSPTEAGMPAISPVAKKWACVALALVVALWALTSTATPAKAGGLSGKPDKPAKPAKRKKSTKSITL